MTTDREGPDQGRPEQDPPDALSRALEVVASIVAPTTLLTALLFYFGLLYAVGYYRQLGVNFTVLDLPAQGFLILSASTAVLPLALLAATTLLFIGVLGLPLDRLSERPRAVVLRAVVPAVAVAGVVLIILASIDALFGADVFPETFWEARGLSLTLGVLLLVYAARVRRILTYSGPRREQTSDRLPEVRAVARWGSLFALIAIGLFWAVGSYAIRVGGDGARGLVAGLRCTADVILYSERSLNLGQSGVREERAAALDGAYGFRYPGLKLVPQSGDQYLLLPPDWAPAARPAIVLPRSDTLRLEFVAPRPGC